MTTRPVTQADIDASYQLGALLQICTAAVKEVTCVDGESTWHIEMTLDIASEKWGKIHDAMERAQDRGQS